MVVMLRTCVVGETVLPSQNSKQQDPCHFSATTRVSTTHERVAGHCRDTHNARSDSRGPECCAVCNISRLLCKSRDTGAYTSMVQETPLGFTERQRFVCMSQHSLTMLIHALPNAFLCICKCLLLRHANTIPSERLHQGPPNHMFYPKRRVLHVALPSTLSHWFFKV